MAAAQPRRGESSGGSRPPNGRGSEPSARPAPTSPRGLAALAQRTGGTEALREGRVMEPKLDGDRILCEVAADRVRLWTRTGNDKARVLPELCDRLAAALPPGTWLDGEAIYGSGATAEHGKGRSVLGSERPRSARDQITYAVFDLIALGGNDARSLPLVERRQLLERVLERAGVEGVRLVPQTPATEAGYARMIDLGFEGAIVKDPARPYPTGVRGWEKVKPTDTSDFVVLPGFRPHSKQPDTLVGALRLGLYVEGELREVAAVGTGFSMREREAWKADPSLVEGLVAEVAHNGCLSPGVPRFPRLVAIRDDKPPEDCVL